MAIAIGGVFFWLSRFGDAAEFSVVVDDSFSSLFLFCFVICSVFLTCFCFRKLIPRAGVLDVGRPPVLFPVDFARLFVGVLCCLGALSLRDNLFVSSLNIGYWGRSAAQCLKNVG